MNSGDIFADGITEICNGKYSRWYDIIFADWIYANLVNTLKLQRVKWQSGISRLYIEGHYMINMNLCCFSSVTISDYIFFCSVENISWRYKDMPLSICEKQEFRQSFAFLSESFS